VLATLLQPYLFLANSFFLVFQFLFQLDSEGSRSGSSLSLRAVAPSAGGTGGVTSQNSSAPSPAHATAHRGVQRSISATSNKPRRGSTGADTAACELMSTTGNGKDPGSGRQRSERCADRLYVCVRVRLAVPVCV